MKMNLESEENLMLKLSTRDLSLALKVNAGAFFSSTQDPFVP
jgi:hypothetical protein